MGRGKNWKDSEIEALVNAVEPHYLELTGKFTNTITHEYKENLWTVITDEVNSASPVKRNVGQIKEKFKSVKSEVKQKVSEMLRERRKTGGGEGTEVNMTEIENMVADKMFLWQKKLVKMNGIEAFRGIEGGFDSSNVKPKSVTKSLVENQNSSLVSHDNNQSNDTDLDSQFLSYPSSTLTHIQIPEESLESQPLMKGSSQLSCSSQASTSGQIIIDKASNTFFAQPHHFVEIVHEDESNTSESTSSSAAATTTVSTSSTSKKSVKRKANAENSEYKKKTNTDVAVDIGQDMLDIQKQILHYTKSIASSLSELVKVMKHQSGLNPLDPVPIPIIINTNLQSAVDSDLIDELRGQE